MNISHPPKQLREDFSSKKFPPAICGNLASWIGWIGLIDDLRPGYIEKSEDLKAAGAEVKGRGNTARAGKPMCEADIGKLWKTQIFEGI